MKDKRDRTWVTPALSTWNRLSDQLPVEIDRTKAWVIVSRHPIMSLDPSHATLDFFSCIFSIAFFISELKVLNESSNSKDNN